MANSTRALGAPRVVRGSLLAATSAALAIAAHATGGGELPDAASTVLLTGLTGYVATALADRTPGRLGAITVLGGAQLVMHLLLGGLMTHQSGPSLLPGPAMIGAHAVATVLTALLLVRAEAAVRTGISRLFLLLPVRWLPAPITGTGTPRPNRTPLPPITARLTTVYLRKAHGRRGPPAYS